LIFFHNSKLLHIFQCHLNECVDESRVVHIVLCVQCIVPALHNHLYNDSWYSALLQPGGRAAYDKGVALLEGMRQQTTR
jgi:hypothetical protein